VFATDTGYKITVSHNIDLDNYLTLQSGSITTNEPVAIDSTEAKYYRIDQYWQSGSVYEERGLSLLRIEVAHNGGTKSVNVPVSKPLSQQTITLGGDSELNLTGTFAIQFTPNQNRVGFYYMNLTPQSDVTVRFVWVAENSSDLEVTASSIDDGLGYAGARFIESVDSNVTYELFATPEGGYSLDYWECISGSGTYADEQYSAGTKIYNDSQNTLTSLSVTAAKDSVFTAHFKPMQIILLNTGAEFYAYDNAVLDNPLSGGMSIRERLDTVRSGAQAALGFIVKFPSATNSANIFVKLYKDQSTNSADNIFSAVDAGRNYGPSTNLTYYTRFPSFPMMDGFTIEITIGDGDPVTRYYSLEGILISDELATARENAVQVLNAILSYCQAQPGYAEKATQITTAHSNGVTAIGAATDEAGITEAKNNAISLMTGFISGGGGNIIDVKVSVLGCDAHGGQSAETHTLAAGNLTTWIAETDVQLAKGAKVWDALKIVLDANDATYVLTNSDNYIKSITYNDVTLAEFTNGGASGWMYTLNGQRSSLGVGEQPLRDDDVIVLHYTDNYKAEEGGVGDEPGAVDAIATYGGSIDENMLAPGTYAIYPISGCAIDQIWIDGVALDDVQGLAEYNTTPEQTPTRSIVASFAYTINFPNPDNGTLSVIRGADTQTSETLATGSIVRAGEVLRIVAVPDDGYELETFEAIGLTKVDETENDYTVTAKRDAPPSIEITFKPATAQTALASIAITAQPTKTAYTAGEKLNLAGLIVTARYSGGAETAVTEYTTEPADGAALNTQGSVPVTVRYTENGVTKTAEFSVTVGAVSGETDKTVLAGAIESAEWLWKADYTTPAWSEFSNALAAAKTVYDNAGAAQEAIDSAAADLTGKLDGLAASNPNSVSYSGALDGVMQKLIADNPTPGSGSTGGEWAVLALARGGKITDDVQSAYLVNLRQAIAGADETTTGENGRTNVKIEAAKATENERIILALTALGYDASDFEGYDFVAPLLTDTAWVNSQGANSTTFALMALNAKPYPADNSITDGYVATLLSALTDGGGHLEDVDYTAMAIQALAPYKARPAVSAAIRAAINWLNTQTIGDSEKLSQIIVARAAIGQDARVHAAALLTYAADSGFKHVAGGAANTMATEQAAYALVAYDRFVNDKNSLYDMRDAFSTQAEDEITVSFRLIGDTIHGLADAPQYADWIATEQVTLAGTAPFYVYDAFTQAAGSAGLTAGIRDNGNYVYSIAKDGVALAEFGNGSQYSGWKYFVNGHYSGVGLKAQAIQDGDAIVWHYANDYPAEDIAWAASYPDIPALAGITVKAPPSKAAYEAGEQLKLAGLKIEASYGGGATAEIAYATPIRFGVSHANNATLDAAGTIPVTVAYQGKTAAFNITVGASAAQLLAEAKAEKIALIEAAGGSLNEADYTAASWATFRAAIAAAVAEAQGAATVGAVGAIAIPATDGLVTLAQELAEAKAAKIAQIEAVDDTLNAADYTADSWNALQSAIADAIAAVNGAATTADVEAAQIPPTGGLVLASAELADAKAAKIAAILAATNGLNSGDYTPESWGALQSAIFGAIGAANAAEGIDALNAVAVPATDGLVTVASQLEAAKAAKIQLLESAGDGLSEADYTAASWAAYQAAMLQAIADAQNAATLGAVSAVAAPSAGGLVTIAQELAAARAQILARISAATDGRAQGDYTAESWDALQAALSAAALAASRAATLEALEAIAVPDAGSILAARPPAAAAPVEYEAPLANALSYLRASVQSPGFGTSGGEWTILALARGGYADTAYYDGYYSRVLAEIDGKTRLDANKSTENSRAILGLTAIGLDAANIAAASGAANLVAPLADMEWVSRQGINGPIFALLALDSGSYELAGAREALIAAILDAEAGGGGWGLAGTPEPDMTAMALQALAPHRNSSAAAGAAVNRATAWLANQAIADAEGLSQAIVAYAALGIDAASCVEQLLGGYYDDATGGFARNGAVNAMASDQAAYALVAYDRYVRNLPALYDMGDAALLVTAGERGEPEPPEPPAADKAALEAEIARAEVLAQGNYTDAAWGNMQAVLAVARAMAAQAGATQKAVDEAASALAAAISALRASDGGAPGTPGAPGTARRYAAIGVADPGAHGGQTSVYYASRTMEISDSETAFSLLQKTGLALEYAGHREHAGYYVESINGFGEFDDGPRSGWMYSVNGAFPGYSSSLYYLSDGDTVRWLYTRELGGDIDADYAIGGGSAPDSSPGTPAGTGSGNTGGTTTTIADTDTPLAASAGSTGGAGGTGGGIDIVAQVMVDATPATPDAGGRATAKPDAAKVAAAVAEAKKAADEARAGGRADAVAEVVIPVRIEGGAAATSIEAELAAETVKAAADAKDVMLTIESGILALTLDPAALATVARSAGDGGTVVIAARAADAQTLNASQRAAAGNSPVIELAITAGGTAIGGLKGTATVRVPYTPEAATARADYDLLTVYRLEADGSCAEAKGARYDAASGNAVFAAAETGAYFVSEWICPFADIAKTDWFYRAVRYACSNGLMNGADAGFAPQGNLTRAMLVTILFRAENPARGANTTGFTDVPLGQWYSDAIAWASSSGIANGTGGGKFSPDSATTREQFATILYNYANYKKQDTGKTADIAAYTDAGSISAWASDAVIWANATGIITGRTATALAPQGTATRAEAATILQRYLEQAA
jgi:hypothetical protein